MRAVLCKNWGPPETLVVENLPSPKPGNGQILVSVKASGVNFPDVLVIQNKYQFKPELPFSPGSEIAGVVRQVGEGVKGFKLKGCSIVGVFWGEFARREGGLNVANLKELSEWLRAGEIKPLVSATYPLEGAADALNDLMNRKVQGKVVLVTS